MNNIILILQTLFFFIRGNEKRLLVEDIQTLIKYTFS